MEKPFEFVLFGALGGDRRAYRRKLPTAPVEARLFRQYTTLPQALRGIRILTPRGTPEGKLFRKWMAKITDSLLRALGEGPFDYSAALDCLEEWTRRACEARGVDRLTSPHADPVVAFFAEMELVVSRLILLYQDTPRFFREAAAEYYDFDFTDALPTAMVRARLPLHQDSERDLTGAAETLGRILWTWGCAATLNPNVRRAFEIAPNRIRLEALAIAEGRQQFKKGQPPGPTKGKPKKRKVPSPHRARAEFFHAAFDLLNGDRRISNRRRVEATQIVGRRAAQDTSPGARRALSEREARREALKITCSYFKATSAAVRQSLHQWNLTASLTK